MIVFNIHNITKLSQNNDTIHNNNKYVKLSQYLSDSKL